MLSPGQFHKLVPKDPQENILYRQWVMETCSSDALMRRGALGMCRQDLLFYTNTFVIQYNPDNVGYEVEPFITFPFQDAALVGGEDEDGEHLWGILECVEDKKDARWPKSRKMGASWVVLIAFDWLCLFHARKMIGVMSRDEDSVDKSGDPSSLFWKLDFMHEYLPAWLRGPITKKKMHVYYERTQSNIIGEANTSSAFVSGRATAMLIDEFGQFKDGYATFDMTSDVSFCRIFVFTHKDQSGMAYDLCYDAKYVDWREIKTHWTQHPWRNPGLYRYDEETNRIEVLDKSYHYPPDFEFVMEAKPTGGPYPGLRSPWYDAECIRRSDRDVAMNLDIDPRGASEMFFDSYRIAVLSREHGREPSTWTLTYDKLSGRPLELVKDHLGLIKLWCTPRSPVQLPRMRAGAGVDIAAGTGMTPSCLSVISGFGEKMLEYANANIFANDFAVLVAAVLWMIEDGHGNHPLLAWEIQGGAVFDRKVRELGYGPCYVKHDEDALGNPRDNKGKRGVNTAAAHILPLMENYRTALYEQRCINRSDVALEECLRFVYTPQGCEYVGRKRPSSRAEEGSGARLHHGDLPKADAMAWKMVKELGLEKSQDKQDPDWVHPGSLAGRMKLDQAESEELVWN